MRRLSLALGLAVLLGIYLVAARARHDGGGSPYVTMLVERGPITAHVTATGSVNPVKTVQVGTYVSGPIQVISVDFNSPVQRGQLLAKIDPRPFQVKVDGAAADLANARARLDKDRADLALKKVTLSARARCARRASSPRATSTSPPARSVRRAPRSSSPRRRSAPRRRS